MNYFRLLSFFSLTLLLFITCKQETESNTSTEFELNFEIRNGEAPIQYGETALYNDSLDWRILELKSYLSQIYLIDDQGKEHVVTNVHLLDLKQPESWTIRATVEEQNYVSIRFNLGLDEEQNGLDPVLQEPSSPLSIQQNMYWGWASKYKFAIMEGRIFNTGETQSRGSFAYHPGTDPLRREVTLAISPENQTITLSFDVLDLLQGQEPIDIVQENTSHSAPAEFSIVERWMNNFSNAIIAE